MSKVAIIGNPAQGGDLAIAIHAVLLQLDPAYIIIPSNTDVAAAIAALPNASITQAFYQTGLTGIDATDFGSKLAEDVTATPITLLQDFWAVIHPGVDVPKFLFRFDAVQAAGPVGDIPQATYNAAITLDSNRLKAAIRYFYFDFTKNEVVEFWQNLLDTLDVANNNNVPILQQSEAAYQAALDYGAKAIIVEEALA